MTSNMIWPFAKMHGIGNDYIYFNCLERKFPKPEQLAPKLSDRRFGIGGDGIVTICPSKIADYRMHMYNADGSEAEMCGNAVRCVAKFLYEKNVTKKEIIELETEAGIKTLELRVHDGNVNSVRVDMGEPELIPAKIPVICKNETQCINKEISIGDFKGNFTAVSMGNPHAVFFVDELSDSLVHEIGSQIEVHSIFPKKVNVEFVKVISRTELNMRVWERGSGETFACGTGAAAVCVAAHLNKLADRSVLIHLLGGDLEIEWNANNHVFKTGSATFSYEGEVNLNLYDR